jgi:tetratricopeptide (TPR) repeat protein
MRWALVILLVTSTAASYQPSAETAFAAGVQFRHAGKQVEALREFRRAARINPKLPFVQREIGLILLDRRDFDGAASAFRLAIQQDANDLDSRYNLALSLANAGRMHDGMAELEAILQRRPNWALAWFGVGHISAMQARSQEAEQAFRKAVDLDPQLFRPQFELGKILEERGDTEGAIAAFSAGLQANPDSAAARYRLAKLLRQAGREEDAAREFLKTRSLQDQRSRGEQAAAAYTRGAGDLEKGDDAGAIGELKRALELRPDFPEVRALLAEAYQHRGDALERSGSLASAAAEYRLAMELAPQPELANHIGVLLAKLGRTDDAIAMFRRALGLKPEYPGATTNLQHALEMKGSQR